MAKRFSNNAIIITSVQGEQGLQGFQGVQGQACYTGVGDPNNLSLVHPTYNDPDGFVRGTETFYYQDTATGDVWQARGNGSAFVPFAGVVWTKTTINLRGERGDKGPDDFSKVEVNLGNKGLPYQAFTVSSSIPISSQTVAKVIFPGTNAGTISTVQVIVENPDSVLKVTTIYLKDSDGTEIASGTFTGTNTKEVVDLTVTGSFPADQDFLTLSFDSFIGRTGLPTPQSNINFMYLLIT